MIKALSIVFLIYFNLIYYPIATLYNVLIAILPCGYISPFQKKAQHVKLVLSDLPCYLVTVYTLTLVNNCAPGGGESRVVRVCVYIYIICPLKNVTQLGYVLQGILMRCVLHFRV